MFAPTITGLFVLTDYQCLMSLSFICNLRYGTRYSLQTFLTWALPQECGDSAF